MCTWNIPTSKNEISAYTQLTLLQVQLYMTYMQPKHYLG